MSEIGGTSSLVAEINTNISLGDSKLVIQGSGLSSPGSASVTLPVSASHPYFTLVTMIAQSPDWFTGVHGHNLMPNGSWLEKETVIESMPTILVLITVVFTLPETLILLHKN